MLIDENKTTDITFKPEEFVPYQNSNLEVSKRFSKRIEQSPLLDESSQSPPKKDGVKVVKNKANLSSSIVEDHMGGEDEYVLVDHEKGERQPYIYR
jgi:hypothetical protein